MEWNNNFTHQQSNSHFYALTIYCQLAWIRKAFRGKVACLPQSSGSYGLSALAVGLCHAGCDSDFRHHQLCTQTDGYKTYHNRNSKKHVRIYHQCWEGSLLEAIGEYMHKLNLWMVWRPMGSLIPNVSHEI